MTTICGLTHSLSNLSSEKHRSQKIGIIKIINIIASSRSINYVRIMCDIWNMECKTRIQILFESLNLGKRKGKWKINEEKNKRKHCWASTQLFSPPGNYACAARQPTSALIRWRCGPRSKPHTHAPAQDPFARALCHCRWDPCISWSFSSFPVPVWMSHGSRGWMPRPAPCAVRLHAGLGDLPKSTSW
jgi:hypothetical protein